MARVSLTEAVFLLAQGHAVALPTETVYGLAADATSPDAVARIYALKGRPPGHPLIVHVLDDPSTVARLDRRAELLIRHFWPGPLTLVLPRAPSVPDAVTGGRDTVGVRSPAHPLFREVLRQLSRPLAAPSANRFGRVSPTRAEHVEAELPDVPVLDGGPCEVGLESTIVDLSGPNAAMLRPGGVDREAIERLIGPLGTSTTAAPGTLAAHYAPATRVILVTDGPAAVATADLLRSSGLRVAELIPGDDLSAFAAQLYAALRALDLGDHDRIVAALAPERGLGVAINDRLRRAAVGSAGPSATTETSGG